MSKTASLGVALCVAAGLAACDRLPTSAPEEPALDAGVAVAGTPAQAAAQSVRRALKGHVDGSDVYGDACGEGQGVLVTSTGRGTISHFGDAVLVQITCVNLTDFSVIGPAPYTLTAANGDEVGGVLTNVVYTSYGFDLYASITWGTGRFAGATGELVSPTTSTGTGLWSSEVEGWITY
jgi:hypothetical protein